VVSEKCRIDTEILPSLFMRCTTDLNRKDKFPAITHLKFLARDMSEQVLLCASSQTSSIVECWSLRKEGLPVNNIFQQISPVVGDKQPTILKWRILSATNDLDRVSAVALPKLPISLTNTDLKVASDTQFYPGLGLALAFHDGSVHIVHRLSLQTMAVFYSSAAPRPVDEPAIKRPRTAGPAVHFKAMQLSWTSLALVGIDNQSKLSMLRLSPSMGHPLEVGLALRHLLFLLEYCMVTGYDWWDILLHVQPNMVQSLVEKLHEEYTRQTAALQQVLSTRILAMKASLCKLSPCTVTRVCDYHTKLFLIAISSTLKSLLRPHFLNTPDKSPGDRLTEICAKITDVDIDKVMINLKTEEFVLDMNTLQALQQLLQWVGDFVLYLLASLPNQVVMRAQLASRTRRWWMSAACCPASCLSPAWTGCPPVMAWSAACSPSSPFVCSSAGRPRCLAVLPPCSSTASPGPQASPRSTTCGGCTLAPAPQGNAKPAPDAAVSPCSSRPTGPRR
ncbi:MED16 isoform 15, partial [Pongo abelii]